MVLRYLFSKMSQVFDGSASRRPPGSPPRFARPSLEVLERRIVLNNATLLWIGAANGTWSTTTNWVDMATGRNPNSVDNTDNLIFDPGRMAGGNAGANTDSIDNMNQTFARLPSVEAAPPSRVR
jgi:hypothetical protein